MDTSERLKFLTRRIDELLHKQAKFGQEIRQLQYELRLLKEQQIKEDLPKPSVVAEKNALEEFIPFDHREEEEPEIQLNFKEQATASKPIVKTTTPPPPPPKEKKALSLEEYIGGNLIYKVGIVILIIGIGLFVKYAIENGWFPAPARVLLSYMAGSAMIYIAYRLVNKFENYSAVLFSGGMAVLYFTSYGANVFFDPSVLPRMLSFYLMVGFTIVTVLVAMKYDKQIIGLLGMVGAYAVPLLLSNNSGAYSMLFAYMLVINIGILVLAVRKYWNSLLYISFALTWLVFSGSILFDDYSRDTFWPWFFLVFFFELFYAALIVYKVLNKESFSGGHIVAIIANGFVFYILGCVMIDDVNHEWATGLFTLINGLLHLGMAVLVYTKAKNRELAEILSSLFFIFLGLATFIQFDESMDIALSLIAFEASLLYFLAHKYKVGLYGPISYFMMAIAVWIFIPLAGGDYIANSHTNFSVFLNGHLFTALMIIASFVINIIIDRRYPDSIIKNVEDKSISHYLFPAVIFGLSYFMLFMQINHYFDVQLHNTKVNNLMNPHLMNFKILWLFLYTLAFIGVTGLVNLVWWRNKDLSSIMLVFGLGISAIFILLGIPVLNDLRANYIDNAYPSFSVGTSHLWIRYISYVFFMGMLFLVKKLMDHSGFAPNFQKYYILVIHLGILIILSQELTTCLVLGSDPMSESFAHKVGYTILWALYAFMMMGLGFWQKSKILRMAALALFTVTLLKLFFVDLWAISTVSRTFLFIAIGLLLMIISYFYQKYKDVLFAEDGEE